MTIEGTTLGSPVSKTPMRVLSGLSIGFKYTTGQIGFSCIVMRLYSDGGALPLGLGFLWFGTLKLHREFKALLSQGFYSIPCNLNLTSYPASFHNLGNIPWWSSVFRPSFLPESTDLPW